MRRLVDKIKKMNKKVERDIINAKEKMGRQKKDMMDYIYNNFEIRKHIKNEEKKQQTLKKLVSDLKEKIKASGK